MIEAIYDFLRYLVFGPDLPYLQKAEPITLATLALIAGGTKLAQAAAKGIRARKQRKQGEEIAEQALQRLEGLDYQVGPDMQVGPKLGVTQDTRDLADLQMRQSAEAMKNLREGNLAMSQQAIASGVMDPTRTSQSIASLAPSLAAQLGQTELAAAQQSTAAKQNVANLAEGYAKANVLREQGVLDRNILRAQQVGDLNIAQDRALQEALRREGQTAASLGYATGTEAIMEGMEAPMDALSAIGYGAPSGNTPLTAQQLGLQSLESGGQLNDQIYVTGGEFNHDTNKKALIDEETGEKEAELTGDEAVLNPEQTENTMEAFNILKDAISKMQNPPEELLAALEKMSHFDEPQFQVPQQEIQFA